MNLNTRIRFEFKSECHAGIPGIDPVGMPMLNQINLKTDGAGLAGSKGRGLGDEGTCGVLCP